MPDVVLIQYTDLECEENWPRIGATELFMSMYCSSLLVIVMIRCQD
jgi:hypothetical protein